MIEYSVGVVKLRRYDLKRLDQDYFASEEWSLPEGTEQHAPATNEISDGGIALR
jgi:hypothetical protein